MRVVFVMTAALWFLITMSLSESQVPVTGPCLSPAQCRGDLFFKPKQCNITGCWCVGQCGEIIPGTYGDDSIACDQAEPPCLVEYKSIHSSGRLLGRIRPRCHPDGFYYHTQCRESQCYCTDKCGNTISGSSHPVYQIRDNICVCPNNHYAYNCPDDLCEGAVCEAYPDAVCRVSICGGCNAEFAVNGTVVECTVEEITSCTDLTTGKQYPLDSEFERGCDVCVCAPSGELLCKEKPCAPVQRDGPAGWSCNIDVPQDGCCPQLNCMIPEYECPPNSPVAMCARNECLHATCEAHPNAICGMTFCGSDACTTIFVDKDKNRLDCRIPKEKPKEPSDLVRSFTSVPATSCIPITCSNACGSSGRIFVNGCEACECVDGPVTTTTTAPTTIPTTPTPSPCPLITCSNACGSSGRIFFNGCRSCECVDRSLTTLPSTTTTLPPTTTPPTSSPCPPITCSNACGSSGRLFINGCESCECVDGPITSPPTTIPPTTSPCPPITCANACGLSGRKVVNGCQSCDCEDTPAAEGCYDFSGKLRKIDEVYEDGCQRCICTKLGEPFCSNKPCEPPRNEPPVGCQYVTPPGGCCPTRLACMEHESKCRGPIAQCFSNTCLDVPCERYPDAKCVISFCGLRSCQAIFYDENDKELDCNPVQPEGCVDEVFGKTYKEGDGYKDGCNYCTCLENGFFACTEKYCIVECIDETTGKSYKSGDVINDGLNQCLCNDAGIFECTLESNTLSVGFPCDPWTVNQIGIASRPRCQPDGSFSPKQCSDDGICWCVDYLGVMKLGTLVGSASLVECETEPPCRIELAANQRKLERGKPVTSDPVCDKDGYYQIEQCDSSQCWCSERDGTIMLGSYASRREDLLCTTRCFGRIALSSYKCTYHSGCPDNYYCHLETCCQMTISEP